jgi:hypothetical protein
VRRCKEKSYICRVIFFEKKDLQNQKKNVLLISSKRGTASETRNTNRNRNRKMNTYCSNIQVTIRTTADSLDPNQTAANPEQSLINYRAEIDAAITNDFPGAEITHINEEDGKGITIRGLCDNDYADYVERTIQNITEDIYAQGSFWA